MPRAETLRELIRPYYLRWLYFPLLKGSRPDYFDRPWSYPAYPIEWLAAAPEASAAPDFVFYPMTDWHSRIQRSQQLPRALAAIGHRSFYLNPHLGRHFRKPRFLDPSHRASIIEPRVIELHVRLPREPVFHHRLLRTSETRILSDAILQACGGSRAAQIVGFPFWLDAAERVRQMSGHPIVYDCHDLLSGFDRIAPEILARESDLFATCDLAVFSSETLMASNLERFPRLREISILLRNGVDASLFKFQPVPRETPRTAGYVGALDRWFDTDALHAAATEHSQCRFVLVGRIEHTAVERLRRLPNVEFTGEAPYHEIPGILASFDCAMIPFLRNPLTLATNPIKLYEYFSCGLPVAAASLPEIENFRDLVYTGNTPREFAASVGKALREKDAVRRLARRAVAERESWAARAQTLLGTLDLLSSNRVVS